MLINSDDDDLLRDFVSGKAGEITDFLAVLGDFFNDTNGGVDSE